MLRIVSHSAESKENVQTLIGHVVLEQIPIPHWSKQHHTIRRLGCESVTLSKFKRECKPKFGNFKNYIVGLTSWTLSVAVSGTWAIVFIDASPTSASSHMEEDRLPLRRRVRQRSDSDRQTVDFDDFCGHTTMGNGVASTHGGTSGGGGFVKSGTGSTGTSDGRGSNWSRLLGP